MDSPGKPRLRFVRRVTVAELYTIVAPTSGVPSAARQRTRTLGGQVDDDRIRDFVDGEYAKVVATVALVCGSVATAEDSVQEALAHAWERLDRGDGIDRLAAWVTTVALNLARSQMRRWRSERRARDRLGPLRDDLSNAPAASGDAHAVREALRALPRRQREVTVLRYYLGLDVREIAEHLGIAEGTVKAMLFRARQSLAVTLADDDRRPRRWTVPTDDPRLEQALHDAAPDVQTHGVVAQVTRRRTRRRSQPPDHHRCARTRRAPRGRHDRGARHARRRLATEHRRTGRQAAGASHRRRRRGR